MDRSQSLLTPNVNLSLQEDDSSYLSHREKEKKMIIKKFSCFFKNLLLSNLKINEESKGIKFKSLNKNMNGIHFIPLQPQVESKFL